MRGTVKLRHRQLLPDPQFGSVLVAKFINNVMLNGKKETARAIVYKALDQLAEATNMDAKDAFEQSIKNVAPLLEVKSRRIGGDNYQVPMEVRPARKNALAFRWIIDAARSRQGASMDKFLAEELINAFNNTGNAIKKKEDMHRMAEANRAFAHFARF
jgi:small subunit ribosomal protein S7